MLFNRAPYSFFNADGEAPPMLVFCSPGVDTAANAVNDSIRQMTRPA